MTYWSLFAGAGGFDIGLEKSGHRCLVQVECDRDANRVRRRHWPHVEHVRDVIGMSRLPKRFGDWRTRWERPELIVGGFPCQDLSVAGKRTGLAGNRSGLWWQMLRIITGMRPDYVLWENVPGLLSSDGGRDFERVIHSLGERGYFGCTRVLDARHFGVPQRRRRVFGLFARGHLGAERCREILAVGTGVSGHSPKGGEAGEDVAGTIGGGSGKRGWCSDVDRMTFIPATSPSVTAKWAKGHKGSHANAGGQVAVAFAADDYAAGTFEECTQSRPLTRSPDRSRAAPLTIGTAVRRLTPRECERLMGWPDDWTRWDDEGKELKDGPRYRLCGNGVVANVAEWIGTRIQEFGQ